MLSVPLVRTRGVFVEDVEGVLTALHRYARGTADVAAYLILVGAGSHGAAPLVTFDRKLAREPDAKLLGLPTAR